MRSQVQTSSTHHQGNAGVVAGLLGCIFAVLGIFTWGFLFVPIAALCSLIGLLSGVAAANASGIGISILSTFLTIVGLASSPILLLLLGLSLIEPQTTAKADLPASRIEQKDDVASENIPCPVGGNVAVLRGIASRQSNSGRTVFILKTDKPFCLTLTPPVAPRQRAVLSSVEIEGQPPPLGVMIELTGKMYASPPTSDGAELPVLSVASGKRLDQSK